jgi:hypothetical protein
VQDYVAWRKFGDRDVDRGDPARASTFIARTRIFGAMKCKYDASLIARAQADETAWLATVALETE